MATTYNVQGPAKRPQAVTASAGTYTGFWREESQLLTIKYTRLPVTANSTAQNLPNNDLSSTVYYRTNINGTKLGIVAIPQYAVVKLFGTFSTSADTQLQKFSIVPQQTDYYGNNYGTVSGTKLGPAGLIYTSQPYQSRRPWDDTTDIEVAPVDVRCTNVIAPVIDERGRFISVANPEDFLWNQATFDKMILPIYAGTAPFIGAVGMLPRIGYGNTPSYTLLGGYTLGQETDAQLYSFITSVGASIRTSTLYGTNLTAGVDVREGWALGTPQVYDTANLGMSVYDETRHDYT